MNARTKKRTGDLMENGIMRRIECAPCAWKMGIRIELVQYHVSTWMTRRILVERMALAFMIIEKTKWYIDTIPCGSCQLWEDNVRYMKP
jgi:hypothetical protein